MGSGKDCAAAEGSCPYWSISNRSCLYGKGGIYLPVTEHIHTYCQTPNYLSCPQLEGQPFAGSLGLPKDEFQNRRGYKRVPGRFVLRLLGRIKDEDLVSVLDDQACTVDISPGGIRFESFREVPVDSLVSFSLVADSFEDPLEGVGRVKWCISLENAHVFHAGIAFTDTSVPSAVRNRLGLIVN